MKLRNGKKGQFLMDNLVKIILIVLGLAILIGVIVFFARGFDSDIDQESCHQSIIFRASARAGAFDLTDEIPLKCKTGKICLSLSGEDCTELVSTSDNKVRKTNLKECENEECASVKKEIIEVFIENMVSCHSMVGEGKLNFFPHDTTSFSDTKYGIICNRIVFDEEAKAKIGKISYGELYSAMQAKLVAGENKNALEYLYPGIENSVDFIRIYDAIAAGGEDSFRDSEEYGNLGEYREWGIDLQQKNGFAIVTSIATQSQGFQFLKGAGAAVGIGGALLWTGIGTPIGALILAGSAGSAVFLYEFEEEFTYSPPAIYPFDLDILNDLGVYSFEVAP